MTDEDRAKTQAVIEKRQTLLNRLTDPHPDHDPAEDGDHMLDEARRWAIKGWTDYMVCIESEFGGFDAECLMERVFTASEELVPEWLFAPLCAEAIRLEN